MEEEKQDTNPLENANETNVPSSPAENSAEQQENRNDNSVINIEETESTENTPKKEEVIIENEPDFFDKLGKKAIWLALGLAVCIATYVYWDFLIFDRVLLYTDIGSDSVNIFYPVWAHYADLWREPGMPSWTMQWAMGSKVAWGLLTDPFSFFLFLIGKNNIPYSLVYLEVLKILLCVYFIFNYLKFLELKSITCIIGSLLFAFSGYLIIGSSGWYIHSLEALMVSFFLYSSEKFISKNSWQILIIFSFFMALSNTVVLFQLFFIFIFYSLFRNYEKNKHLKVNIKTTLLGLISYITGCILAFPALKIGINSLFDSGRAEASKF